MDLISYISSIIPVSEPLRTELYRITSYSSIPRNTTMVRQGDRCNDLYFAERGLLRGYYYNEEKEITAWFAREGEFATSFYSFITRTPTREFVETLEDTELAGISYQNLQQLYLQFPETERIGRLLTEQYYIKLEGRLQALQFTTAKERYETLLASNPQLLQRAPLGCIASYLGITQETLSRIRSGAARGPKAS